MPAIMPSAWSRGVDGVFFQPDGARRLVVEHEVGEGAAHVDAEPEHAVSDPRYERSTSGLRRRSAAGADKARPRRS